MPKDLKAEKPSGIGLFVVLVIVVVLALILR
jgi:Tfp pilus assembly protein PilX